MSLCGGFLLRRDRSRDWVFEADVQPRDWRRDWVAEADVQPRPIGFLGQWR